MEQARQMAERYLGGDKGPAPGEAAEGGVPAQGKPHGGMVDFLAEQAREHFGDEHQSGSASAGGPGLLSQAQHLMQAYGGGRAEERPAAEGAPSAQGGGIVAQAQHLLGGGGGGQGSPATGIVDQVLSLFQQHEGRPFTGKDPVEFDRLHELAGGVLGSPIGREVLMAGVRQKLGM